MRELSPSKFVPDSPWLVPRDHKPVGAPSYSPTSFPWHPPKLIPAPLYFYFEHKFPNKFSRPDRIAYLNLLERSCIPKTRKSMLMGIRLARIV